jgi:hypothetical protein
MLRRVCYLQIYFLKEDTCKVGEGGLIVIDLLDVNLYKRIKLPVK